MSVPNVTPQQTDAVELAASIRVTSGSPTPVELAAVTAVVVAAVEELAQADRRHDASSSNAWERRRRGLRQPLVRGDWRRAVR